MRKDLTNNPVKQMPQISGKVRFEAKSLLQLPCNRFDQSPFARGSSDGLLGQTVGWFCCEQIYRLLWERCQQSEDSGPQSGSDAQKSIV